MHGKQAAFWNFIDRHIHDKNCEPSAPAAVIMMIILLVITHAIAAQFAGVLNFRALF